jgi:diaminohydroxyphosphoribosylaminopyrimidine deaminase/5-amino-6-(5-phosphoribosylamino)uracil reductase
MNNHEIYIQRCFDLAKKGLGTASPNPIVGAVLVFNNRIIGEGWHEKYGGAHAEVNALKSVKEKDRGLIPNSTLYVSLEPCCIFGKTPPCTNLIIENNIPEVVISCLDLTPKVAGNGVEILRNNGVKVTVGILEKEGKKVSRIRNTFVSKNRPYIILKYAQSKDGFIGKVNEQIWITNLLSKRLVHKWRAETSAILVGTQTAKVDNPSLTTRYFYGTNPLRILLDKDLKLPKDLNVLDKNYLTWIVNSKLEKKISNQLTEYLKIPFDENLLSNLLSRLYQSKRNTLIVEGGAITLQNFIDQNLWDEARILVGDKWLGNGINAPQISGIKRENFRIGTDILTIVQNSSSIR